MPSRTAGGTNRPEAHSLAHSYINELSLAKLVSDNGVDDPERLRNCVNVVNTEDRGSAQYSGNNACKSAGVAFRRIRNTERFANNGLSRDRQKNRPSETLESVQRPINSKVIRSLFGKVDSGIENDGVACDSGGHRDVDLLLKKPVDRADHVFVKDMCMFLFRKPDGVHDEQSSSMCRRDPSILICRQGAHIIQ